MSCKGCVYETDRRSWNCDNCVHESRKVKPLPKVKHTPSAWEQRWNEWARRQNDS